MNNASKQSYVSIDPNQLKVGMYVILPSSWLHHPFFRSEFKVTSEKEIDKIINAGFNQILVDYSRGDVKAPEAAATQHANLKPPRKWKPEEIVPKELKEVMSNSAIPRAEKAAVLKKSSLVLMDRLLMDPSTENLTAAKEGIYDIVDFVMSDDETSKFILNITNHDFYTYTHSVNVGFFALLLSKSFFKGSPRHNMRELGAGFFLHDMGKVSIDPNILNKPGNWILTKWKLYADILLTEPGCSPDLIN